MTKREREILELSWSFYVFMFLFMYSFILTCIWCIRFGHMLLYEELILWFGSCFEVGMNLCVNNFIYDVTVVFGKLCIYFMVDI